MTAEKHEHLIGIEQGRYLHFPFETEELAALGNFKPSAVYAGMNVPCTISAQAADLILKFLA